MKPGDHVTYEMDLIYTPPQLPIYTVVDGPNPRDNRHDWPWIRVRQLKGFTPRGQDRGIELSVATDVMRLWKTREELVAEMMMR